MNTTQVMHLATQAMIMAAKLAAPLLITALVVGFAISVFQSMTQIQEATLSFVPKAIAVAVALAICGHWMISELVSFTQTLMAAVPSLISGT